MRKPQSILTLTCAAAMLLGGCAEQPSGTPDTRATDEAAIRAADIAWSKVGAAKDVDGHVGYYTTDAIVMPPNEPLATGKESVRKVIADLYAMPGLALSWQPVKVVVARSGDIGYSQGTYELTANDASGKPMTDRGKYLEVWKKQADGSWKCAVDTFNSDLPAAPPPSK